MILAAACLGALVVWDAVGALQRNLSERQQGLQELQILREELRAGGGPRPARLDRVQAAELFRPLQLAVQRDEFGTTLGIERRSDVGGAP